MRFRPSRHRGGSGGVGGQILNAVLGAGSSGGMVGDVASGGIGGIVVMLIVGLIRSALAKK